MSFEWIQNPLTLYAVVALALVGSLALFVSAKLEAGDQRRILAKRIDEVQSSLAKLSTESPPLAVPPALTRQSINLTKRTQALRMRHRGEPIESITAALQVPKNEVELLLKVNELLSSQNATATKLTSDNSVQRL
jgi:hypothetical protein